jgi:hypothetical protein
MNNTYIHTHTNIYSTPPLTAASIYTYTHTLTPSLPLCLAWPVEYLFDRPACVAPSPAAVGSEPALLPQLLPTPPHAALPLPPNQVPTS